MAFLAALPALISAAAVIYDQIQKSQRESEVNQAQAGIGQAQTRAANNVAAFAPVDKAARLNVQQSQLSSYGPLDAWMQGTYGPGAAQNLQAKDPFQGTGWGGGKA